jgi:Nif-specific regulatory protein
LLIQKEPLNIKMQARLAAISGKLKGAIIAIKDDSFVIGREVAANLCIADASVSRRHSLIEKQGENIVISDLESLNGTFVNDVPVRTRVLEHGDRVRIGESQFLYLAHEAGTTSKSSLVRLDGSKVMSGATLQVRFDDAFYLMARDLSALMKISATINAIRGLEALQERLLELLFEVVPAQYGAIVLVDDDRLGNGTVFGLDRTLGKDCTVTVSATIAQQVLRDGVALLASNALGSDFSSDSLIESATASVLCVPLIMMDRKLGVLYLATSVSDHQFNKDHLQLVTAISGIAAVAIENARRFEWLESENQRLLADVNIEHNMIGESAAMRNVFEFIARVAPTDSTVLIVGETGTGKELVSRALHQNSKRLDRPFVAINCATLSENLLESELFGHEKGSFTGAVALKKGKFEIADGGTIFLDEIGEIAPTLQAKLLRVLQERQFERVGGTSPIHVDIRIIAATNKNLQQAVQQGLFRQDLYYRLNVLQLKMPALRERVEDIPLLATHFASKYCAKVGKKIVGLSPEVRRHLVCYNWPGNVRELENAIERALVLGTVDRILPEDLPEIIIESQPPNIQLSRYQEAVKESKRQLILRAMEQAGDNYVEAAAILEIHPNNLHRLIRDLDLKSTISRARGGNESECDPNSGS